MLSILDKYDKMTALGLLARAAIYIEKEEDLEENEEVQSEKYTREKIIEEIKQILEIKTDFLTEKEKSRIADFLDEKSNFIIDTQKTEEHINAMSENGTLPSDLYTVNIIENISKFCGEKFQREKDFIETTVKKADREQHYGNAENKNEPELVSLFSKYFPNKYPFRSFTMLVIGQRRETVLHVHQAWRLYSDLIGVKVPDDKNLVGLLRFFSEHFGTEVEMGGIRGKFILIADEVKDIKDGNIKLIIDQKNKRTFTVSWFTQKNERTGNSKAALVVGIDLSKYKEYLLHHGW
ncbi:protein of unknown function [Acidithiobacillus ferrivorans]|uniref:Uncharacterized protein n=1 Tax=Acidithiobacillus ferrivorans TaxID=160808 RepID=A0A060UMZ0_9PROT|nr:hypothetical protein [Acidithiobacillus ferrivorans]CDQ09835.1 hypothetical protein AFERRI_310003 [Acidithiobacillus ferrivorans]SMH66284.1 protein of unknown function [Acidithiobacillus ferrivorans]